MHRVRLHYTLARDGDTPARLHNPLVELLQAVARHGSISAAARALGFSYRHVWGELRRWEDELGDGLVTWDKGQPARLTGFGHKLMWAERQAQARLAPQIDALRGELERAFAVAFDAHAHVLTLHASHDNALATLREHALALGPDQPAHDPLHLDVRFCGSVDAIRALNEGRCSIAGFHVLRDPPPGSLAERTYKPLLRPGRHKIVGFAERTQGLIVAPGNPLALRDLRGVRDSGARFVNRALGTGTRLLLDELLRAQAIPAAGIAGYERTEPSHAALAHAVADGSADCGLGIAAAARELQLDFVPLATEDYYLVCLKSALEQPATRMLRTVLQDPTWQARLAAMPGYTPRRCGEVLALRDVLPWWRFTARTNGNRRTPGRARAAGTT